MNQERIVRQKKALNHEMKVLKNLIKKKEKLEKIFLSIIRDDETTWKVQVVYDIRVINGEFLPVTFRMINKFNPKEKVNLTAMMIDYKLDGNLVTSNHIINVNNLSVGSYNLTAHIKSIKSAPIVYNRSDE